MRAQRFEPDSSLAARVMARLAEAEAENNLALGMLGRLRADPHGYGKDDPYLGALLDDDGAVRGVALCTPPFGLALTRMEEPEALAAIAADVADRFETLPSVLGPKPTAERFARLWEGRRGVRAELAIAQRVFEADAITPPPVVPGAMRRAGAEDVDVLVAFMTDFEREALPGDPPRSLVDVVDRFLGRPDSGLCLWEVDGRPVSMAGYGAPTPRGIRVSAVYTPPELRGRGYASANVAATSRMLLEGGRRFCFLFTDLSNPTSNALYRRLGYRPVADMDRYRFEARTGG